jgi:hypothetical protein
VIPPGRLDPSRLRDEARGFLACVSESRIAKALQALLRVKLLAEHPGGGFLLCEYGTEQMPRCMSCHNPNPDHRRALCPTCRVKMRDHKRRLRAEEKALRARLALSSETSQDIASVSPRDRTGGEDGRKEGFSSDSVPEQSTEVVRTPVPEPEERARIARSKLEGLNRKFRLGGSHGPA